MPLSFHGGNMKPLIGLAKIPFDLIVSILKLIYDALTNKKE